MKILIFLTHPHVEAWNFQDRHREQFSRHCPEYSVVVCRNSKEFLAELSAAEGVIAWYFKREWQKISPQLKWIATPAAGRDWIDVEPSSNIPVLFGGFHGQMMAESVLGAALYFCKAFQFSRDLQKKKKWARVKISQKDHVALPKEGDCSWIRAYRTDHRPRLQVLRVSPHRSETRGD